jgi:hypothetical protein
MDFDRELDEIQVNLSHYLTKREYYSKVIFTSDLLFDLYMGAIDARIYYWLLMTEKALFKKGISKIKKQHYRGQ